LLLNGVFFFQCHRFTSPFPDRLSSPLREVFPLDPPPSTCEHTVVLFFFFSLCLKGWNRSPFPPFRDTCTTTRGPPSSLLTIARGSLAEIDAASPPPQTARWPPLFSLEGRAPPFFSSQHRVGLYFSLCLANKWRPCSFPLRKGGRMNAPND